jgi:hypothetical protein
MADEPTVPEELAEGASPVLDPVVNTPPNHGSTADEVLSRLTTILDGHEARITAHTPSAVTPAPETGAENDADEHDESPVRKPWIHR